MEMDQELSIFAQKSLLLVFTYAPAGFGHLRVTDALYDALPKEVHPLLIGSDETSVSAIHRAFSIHPLLRRVMEWTQAGKAEDYFTTAYRSLLRKRSKGLYRKLVTIIDQRIEHPKIVLIVATHFGIAHQVGAIKKRLERNKNVKVLLLLQVTDDSPQHLWYVPEADIIFVPSHHTKEELQKYAKEKQFKQVQFEVVGYPVSPQLGALLPSKTCEERTHQINPKNTSYIHVTIPISGAAVGTQFFTTVIDSLHAQMKKFMFHVVVKSGLNTFTFLNEMKQRSYVELHVANNDRGVVNEYERVYRHEIISLEITKPSEQTFKALLTPAQVGGVLLLFSEPIGRQEYDNLDFLRRHGLLPTPQDQLILWDRAKTGKNLEDKEGKELLFTAGRWRGLMLPKKPEDASRFITWGIHSGLFAVMMTCKVKPLTQDKHAQELDPQGVKTFWTKAAQFLKNHEV